MNKIANILKNSVLPGSIAHAEMMPEGRRLDFNFGETIPVHSAVLLLLYHQGDSMRVVFIERADYDGIHGGQTAFPGGRYEAEDENFMATAIRETIEEIEPDQPVTILGKLSDLYVPPSKFLIHPFVAYIKDIPTFKPDQREVKAVFTEDLKWFVNPESRKSHHFKARQEQVVAPCFVSGNHFIWGATAMIFNEFLVLLLNNGYFQNK